MRRLTAVILVIFAAAAMAVLVVNKDFLAEDNSKNSELLPLIRLHIIANSDDEVDQQLKLKVRDAIIKYLEPKFAGVKDLSQARKIVDSEKANFELIAKNILTENSKNYSVQALHGRYMFPPKNYGAFFLPAGEYEALRVVLGKGEGKNWWCVLYPPLCLIKESGYDMAKVDLSGGKPKLVVKSKLQEIFGTK